WARTDAGCESRTPGGQTQPAQLRVSNPAALVRAARDSAKLGADDSPRHGFSCRRRVRAKHDEVWHDLTISVQVPCHLERQEAAKGVTAKRVRAARLDLPDVGR